MAEQTRELPQPVEAIETNDKPLPDNVRGNLSLWLSVWETDPAFTKEFNRGGGFKGTATNPTYMAMRATATFGPIGIGWGVEEVEHFIEGHDAISYQSVSEDGGPTITINVPPRKVWFSKVRVWYFHPTRGEQGKVEQWGATEFVGKNSKGIFIDDEAAKKAITDGMSKCLSLLGFAADIHLGRFDDAKYVAGLRDKFGRRRAARREAPDAASQPQTAPAGNGATKPSEAPGGTKPPATQPAAAKAAPAATQQKAEPTKAAEKPAETKPAASEPAKVKEPAKPAAEPEKAAPAATPAAAAQPAAAKTTSTSFEAAKSAIMQNNYKLALKAIEEAKSPERLSEIRGKLRDPKRPLAPDQIAALEGMILAKLPQPEAVG
jgi:hypothetical protein